MLVEAKVFFEHVDTQGFWLTVFGLVFEFGMRHLKTRRPASFLYILSHTCAILSVGLHNVALWSDAILGQNAAAPWTAPEPPK